MPSCKLEPISLLYVKTELKSTFGTDFMAFLVKALFSWNECLQKADISILSNFWAIFFQFFSSYREILPNAIYIYQVSDQLNHSN